MTELKDKHCAPCEGGVPALPADRIADLAKQIPAWQVVDGKKIRRSWKVKDFLAGMEFFRRVAEVAEAEDHHPDLHLVGYRDVTVELWTHAVNGLTENDFILAAKIDRLPATLKT